MNEAVDICLSVPYTRARDRVGCVAYDSKGKPLGTATNNYSKTHPIQAKFAKMVGLDDKIYLHAEISCIIRSQKNLKRNQSIDKLSIVRLNRTGHFLKSKPCEVCCEAIKQADISFVEYYDGSKLIEVPVNDL